MKSADGSSKLAVNTGLELHCLSYRIDKTPVTVFTRLVELVEFNCVSGRVRTFACAILADSTGLCGLESRAGGGSSYRSSGQDGCGGATPREPVDRRAHPNLGQYCMVNDTVPVLALYFDGGSDLRVDFRLSRGTFQSLMAYLATAHDHGWGPVIEALVFLFWLASGTSYRVVCRAFAMPRSTVHMIVHRTSRKVVALLPQVIRLPAEGDLGRLGAGFSRLAGSAAFSRVVGSIDGCHMRVKPPKEDAACYLNRKLLYSVQFQAVVDNTARFLDVFIGFPVSALDSRVLKHSPIYYHQMYPPPGYCIIWDGGYTCLEQPISLMTPFRMPHNQLQVCFNSHLSRGRCVVERAFSILKTRPWRCLSNGDLLEPEDGEEEPAEDNQPQPAPQDAVCGAEARQRMARLCFAPEHDYA
ncbi:Protein ALP1-like [Merluccius polli]|uniref:Protein ALP1-like n=1 Tax=Merluccius polli TaxID=89951 RepID=A0AA47MMR0_MERPO|nr:Protein ALP1-like [Merluccius polli]